MDILQTTLIKKTVLAVLEEKLKFYLQNFSLTKIWKPILRVGKHFNITKIAS